jgi:hypothetical protein
MLFGQVIRIDTERFDGWYVHPSVTRDFEAFYLTQVGVRLYMLST